MKTICIIIPGRLPVPSICGGAVESLVSLLLAQNELEKLVKFIVVCPWAEGIDEVVAQYKYTEFHFFHVRDGIVKKGINLINYIIAIMTKSQVIDLIPTPMQYAIRRKMKHICADAVFVEHGVYKHFAFLRKKYHRNRLYLHWHGTGPAPDQATRKTFGHFWSVSEYLLKMYRPAFEGHETDLRVLLNAIDDTKFNKRIDNEGRIDLRRKYGVNPEDFLIIYCGRLVKEKGVRELVRAVMGCNNPKIKLMVVGSSNFKDARKTPYVQELERLICGSENRIFCTGYIDSSELYRYYQASEIQVVCSIGEEAAGLVGIEGMMSGLPLIITDSGGIPEYIRGDYHYIVRKGEALNDDIEAQLFSERLRTQILYCYDHREECKSKIRWDLSIMEEFSSQEYYRRFIKNVEDSTGGAEI